MSNTVIKVSNLSKRYRIGLKEDQSETLLGQIGNAFSSPLRNLQRLNRLNKFKEEDESVFWALKDISFEVKEGEVLGIIGKNGAGKSTLLKILSQITEPTSGKIEVHGRVASLLEVGTGFHPELSGRENIFMNGTILGMTRKEIDRKLDEIIDFSGVEKFIDTPVKFYSSGMKVRLGFSVAAHLEPEILIIDEVLAVGDAEFQKKCLGKMDEVSKVGGRTILFVSHNLKSLSELCSVGVLIESGRILLNSDIENCIKKYNNTIINKEIYIISGSLLNKLNNPIISLVNIEEKNVKNGEFHISVEYNSPFVIINPIIGVVISDEFGSPICGFNNRFYKGDLRSSCNDVVVIKIHGLFLHTGQYFVSVYLGDSIIDYHSLKDVISFNVVNRKMNYLQVPPVRLIGNLYLENITWSSK